ncbi:hypothetical protein [Ancylobacter defluvii]|uniref:Uncharacterized protein n=1 Tax=Ancylobacter defluvii TaxID=1282440 RepID=A0A9W6NCD7_9HYPH|nr:hypothetical protein [Ancylobacter defluvii]MBS7586412.1 hypothetical protein [Ancylobacter defluvii]GLK85693.1 hypothetical protein GCM10017653_37630 [Ancylobacter defluvii]
MTALTAERDTPYRDSREFYFPVAAAKKIFQGALVALDAAGNLTPGATATTLHGGFMAAETIDNTAGAAGAASARVLRGCYRFENSAAGDAITRADIGTNCYIVDDQTVAKTNGTNTRSVAGIVRDVDAQGVWVEF